MFFTTFVFYVPESCWYDAFSRNLSLCFPSCMIRFWFSKSLLIIPPREFEKGTLVFVPACFHNQLYVHLSVARNRNKSVGEGSWAIYTMQSGFHICNSSVDNFRFHLALSTDTPKKSDLNGETDPFVARSSDPDTKLAS